MVGGHRPGVRGRGTANKTVFFGMMHRKGQVMTEIVPDGKRKTLDPIIEQNVKAGSMVHTDELHSDKGLWKKGHKHQTVNHGVREYVVGEVACQRHGKLLEAPQRRHTRHSHSRFQKASP